MASIIRIKRSQTAGNPGTLGAGELAYSALTNNDSNGGDRLYVGIGTETGGNAVNHYVIGGKYFTDMMDHTRGTLVADSAILVDADKKINELFVNNLKLTGNTISSTDTNGNIILDPNGSGNVIVKTGAKLIVEDLTATRVPFVGSANELTDNANLTFSTATNTLGTVNVIASAKVKGADLQATNLTSDRITFAGANGLLVDSSNFTINTGTGKVSITGELQVDNIDINGNVISSTDTDGNITLTPNGTGAVVVSSGKQLRVTDLTTARIVYVGASGALKDSNNFRFDDGTNKLTITGQATVGNINVNASTISAIGTDTTIDLVPTGLGTVNVNNTRITGLAAPKNDTDAATKAYVDAAASGLHIHATADAATTQSLALIIGGTVTYTTTTIALSNPLTILDGYTLLDKNRILVKNEATTSSNGIYVWSSTATSLLTRADDFQTVIEISGGDFVFVVNGTRNGDTGWVQTEVTTNIGTSPIIFQQFSGAGTFLAGGGLVLNGNSFEVVGTSNRIVVSADAIDISNSYTGQTSIVTVGAVSQGTWQADTVATTYGGTGRTTFNYGDILLGTTGSLQVLSMGLAGQVLQVNPNGDGVYWAELDGGSY